MVSKLGFQIDFRFDETHQKVPKEIQIINTILKL